MTREIVHDYYEAWAARDREGASALLADDLDFRSPFGSYRGGSHFLECCWEYSDGLTGVEFLKEVCEDDRAFVVLRWQNADGGSFVSAEYVRAEAGRIREILVVTASPDFAELVTE